MAEKTQFEKLEEILSSLPKDKNAIKDDLSVEAQKAFMAVCEEHDFIKDADIYTFTVDLVYSVICSIAVGNSRHPMEAAEIAMTLFRKINNPARIAKSLFDVHDQLSEARKKK